MSSTDALGCKLSEHRTLKNKFLRYKGRLLREGFRAMRDNNIESLLLKNVGEDGVDTEPLELLAKEKYPALYGKFKRLEDRYLDSLIDIHLLLNGSSEKD